jgi:hypothetical protein
MISFFSRDNWSIRRKHKVNSWIWDKIGLEFSDINVKGTIESKGSGK